jgi:hypothetical protein
MALQLIDTEEFRAERRFLRRIQQAAIAVGWPNPEEKPFKSLRDS